MNKNFLSFIIILILLFLLQSDVFAQTNPFLSRGSSTKSDSTKTDSTFTKIDSIKSDDNKTESSHKFSLVQQFFKIQRDINIKVRKLVKDLKDSKSKKTLILLILLSFLYGIVHALGPGHGKVLAFSYFMSKSADIKKGIILGFLTSFFHTLSALLVVLTIYFILKKSLLLSVENANSVLKMISYGGITILGLCLLIKAIIDLYKSKSKKDSKEKDSSSASSASSPEIAIKHKGLLPMALAVGIVPCPGAIFILTFSITMGILGVGIILTTVYSLGMGITISAIGVLTILTRQGTLKIVKSNSKLNNFIEYGAELFGAAVIFILGAFLLISNIHIQISYSQTKFGIAISCNVLTSSCFNSVVSQTELVIQHILIYVLLV